MHLFMVVVAGLCISLALQMCAYMSKCGILCFRAHVCTYTTPRLSFSSDGLVYMRVDSVQQESRGVRRT